MSKFVLTDAYVAVGGIDVSDHCHQAAVDLQTDEIDITPLGDVGYRQTMQGEQQAAAFGVSLLADPATDNALRAATSNGVLSVAVRPIRSQAIWSGNPQYSASCVVTRNTWGAAIGDATGNVFDLVSTGTITIDNVGGGDVYGGAVYGGGAYG